MRLWNWARLLKDCVHQNWRVHEQMQAIPFHNNQICKQQKPPKSKYHYRLALILRYQIYNPSFRIFWFSNCHFPILKHKVKKCGSIYQSLGI